MNLLELIRKSITVVAHTEAWASPKFQKSSCLFDVNEWCAQKDHHVHFTSLFALLSNQFELVQVEAIWILWHNSVKCYWLVVIERRLRHETIYSWNWADADICIDCHCNNLLTQITLLTIKLLLAFGKACQKTPQTKFLSKCFDSIPSTPPTHKQSSQAELAM